MDSVKNEKGIWSVYPIKAGEFGPMPDWMGYRGGENELGYNVPSIIYLLQSGNRNILVDTSFSSQDDVTDKMGIYCKRDRPIALCLEEHGVEIEQIETVILTHLHWDHAGGMDLFPNAAFICQYDEYKWLTEMNEWEIGYPGWFAESIPGKKDRFQFMNGNGAIEDGIEVWLHGGHTPGSQMIGVNTEKGLCIITGDNVMSYENVEKNIPVGLFCDIHECIKALERVKQEADYFIPSHDWKALTG